MCNANGFVLLFAAAGASTLQEVPQHDAYHQGHGFGGMDVDVPISSPQVRCSPHNKTAAVHCTGTAGPKLNPSTGVRVLGWSLALSTVRCLAVLIGSGRYGASAVLPVSGWCLAVLGNDRCASLRHSVRPVPEGIRIVVRCALWRMSSALHTGWDKLFVVCSMPRPV